MKRTRGKGCFEHPGSFRDETYGFVKKSGCTVLVVPHRDETYGDVSFPVPYMFGLAKDSKQNFRKCILFYFEPFFANICFL
jgi:hypothetical protein